MEHDYNDVQVVEQDGHDPENSTMAILAKEVALTLANTYPNYPWVVGWHPGFALAVKLLLNPDYNYGYTIDCRGGMTAFALAHSAKMAGGELLERLDLPRGAWTGEMPTKNIEGVDAGHEAPVFAGINSLSDEVYHGA